jgi:hypothetical protein
LLLKENQIEESFISTTVGANETFIIFCAPFISLLSSFCIICMCVGNCRVEKGDSEVLGQIKAGEIFGEITFMFGGGGKRIFPLHKWCY